MVEKLTADWVLKKMLCNVIKMLIDSGDEQMMALEVEGWNEVALIALDEVIPRDVDFVEFLDNAGQGLEIDWAAPTYDQIEEYVDVIVRKLRKLGRI